jgi:hypothetical protein
MGTSSGGSRALSSNSLLNSARLSATVEVDKLRLG